MSPSGEFEVLTMTEIKARGWIKAHERTVIQYQDVELSPGPSFPIALLETALELCRNYASQGQQCLIVSESTLITVWRGIQTAPSEAATVDLVPPAPVFIPVQPTEDSVSEVITAQTLPIPQTEERYVMYRGTKVPLKTSVPGDSKAMEHSPAKSRYTYRGQEYS